MDEESERIYMSKSYKIAKWNEVGRLFYDNCHELYISGILSKIERESIEKCQFKVVVDCGNGAGSYTMPYLISKVAKVVSINAIRFEPKECINDNFFVKPGISEYDTLKIILFNYCSV